MKLRYVTEDDGRLTFSLEVTEAEMMSGTMLIQKCAAARALEREISFYADDIEQQEIRTHSSEKTIDQSQSVISGNGSEEQDGEFASIMTRMIEEREFSFEEEEIEQEAEALYIGTLKQMQYARMFGDADEAMAPAPDPDKLRSQIRREVIRERQENQILREIIEREGLTVSPEECEGRARQIAAEQGTDLSMVRMFFGEDYSGLKQELLMEKAREVLKNNISRNGYHRQ